MNAILFALAVMSADYPGYGPRACWGWDGTVRNYSCWGYARLYGHGYYPPAVFVPSFVFQPTYSPWNAAVAELRASGRSKSRDLVLPTSTANVLQELALRRSEAYSALAAAPKAEKAELRKQWLAARQELERARILAAKELYRGP